MVEGLTWADYVRGHPERLPRPAPTATGATWADAAPGEARRVTRNWQRWRRRRLAWRAGRPARFRIEGDALMVEGYPGRWTRADGPAPTD